MNGVFEALLEQGGSIVPIQRKKDKAGIKGWHQYQTQAPTKEKLKAWKLEGYEEFGLIMGYGGFQVIDIDIKNHPHPDTDEFFGKIWSGIPGDLKLKLTVQRTRSNGFHLLYKCDVPAIAQDILINSETGKPIIEVIGSKNYILTYPNPGYSVVSGDLSNIQEITKEEHEWLLAHCTKVGDMEANSFPVKVPIALGNLDSTPYQVGSLPSSNCFISDTADYLHSNDIDITSNYHDWVKIAYACANELGEAGRESFHKMSKPYPGYDEHECDTLYNDVLKSHHQSHAGKKVTGATIQHILKNHEVKMPKTPKANKKIAQRTAHAISFIQSKGLMRNLFTKKVEKRNGVAITDGDIDSIFIELRKVGSSVTKSEVISILNSDNIQSFDPLKEWLNEAEQKADDHAISELMACFEFKTTDPVEETFCKQLILKWLMQIPALISDDSMPRLVLVLIGETHIGKTEFFRRLLPSQFGKYYAESALDRDKDSEILMCEYLIINIDELGGIVKYAKTLERFKSLVSASNFSLRVPFGKVNEQFQRKAILCGTSNKVDVIQDHDTGNSRIIPVELISINWARLNAIDKDALFGSISLRFKADKKGAITLSSAELEGLKSMSGEFTTVNVEQELIQKFFKPGVLFMTASEISSHLSGHFKMPISATNVSRELSKLGYKKDRKAKEGSLSKVRGFYVDFTEANGENLTQAENPMAKFR